MNDLGLDLQFPLSAPAPFAVVAVRDLTPEDLSTLSSPKAVFPPTIQRVTERHHALARAIASGMKMGEAAAACGYSISRVSILKQSPAFQELVALYTAEKDVEFAEFGSRLLGLGKDAVVELQDRLENEPEKFTNSQLLELATRAGDRSGYGPVQRTEAVNINVSLGERLAAARRRIIDITPEEK